MRADSDNIYPLRQPEASGVSPHNTEAEQALLGILMMKPEHVPAVSQILQPEHFYFADHREVFAIIEALIAAGSSPTPIAIKSYLKHPNIGDRPAIAYLTACTAELLNWDAVGYAQVVRDLASRRALLAIADTLAEKARTSIPGTLAQSIIDDTEQALLDVRAIVPQAHLAGQTAAQGTAWMLERIAGLRSGLLESTAVPSGIPDLDRATNGGFQRGQLYLLAARPGMGKTIALTSLSRLAARDAGVIVFQCEVTRDQQWARYLADLSYVHNRPLPFGKIMAGVDLDDEEVWRLEDAAKRLDRLHLKVECEPSVSVAQIAFAVKQEKRRLEKLGVRLGVVFIDYLKYIKASDRYQGNRVLEIGEISGSLKQLAKAEDVCVVLLTQLNRQVEAEGRSDRRPALADLRDSGELEQDADTVIFLYREAYYLERKFKATGDAEIGARLITCQNSLEMILGKNRSGPATTLNLWCDAASSCIAQSARGPV
ncbi:replicative DNA helicase [Methylobacterium sp. CM6257]